nr:MAG TPA: hypothetical protein [Microviridae sp.]
MYAPGMLNYRGLGGCIPPILYKELLLYDLLSPYNRL